MAISLSPLRELPSGKCTPDQLALLATGTVARAPGDGVTDSVLGRQETALASHTLSASEWSDGFGHRSEFADGKRPDRNGYWHSMAPGLG